MSWVRVSALLAVVVLLGACSFGSGDESVGVTADSGAVPSADHLEIVYGGQALEQGITYRYAFFIHCGMEWLYDFNGTAWTTDDPIYDGAGRAPDRLRPFFVNPDEVISPELWTQITLVTTDEIRVALPDGSEMSIYHPTDQEWPGCA